MAEFKIDHRANKGLHELYVRWAMNHLSHAQDYVELMSHFSNFNANQLSDCVRDAIAKLVREDAAYHDAAARLFAGEDVPEYLPSNELDEDIDLREAAEAAEFREAAAGRPDPTEQRAEGPAEQVFGRDAVKVKTGDLLMVNLDQFGKVSSVFVRAKIDGAEIKDFKLHDLDFSDLERRVMAWSVNRPSHRYAPFSGFEPW